MATEWLDADRFPLLRAAWMVDEFHRGKGNAALMSELRQLEDRFGLSSYGRRRLAWSIDVSSAEVVPIEGRRSMRAVDEDEG